MKGFLKGVSDYIYKNYREQLADICVVFPNQRASAFFLAYLGEQIDHPVFSPRITTISEMISEQSSLHPADLLSLNMRLYKIYIEETKAHETFDSFFPWGEMLINDFDDLDKYLVKADDLFQNIASLKEIDDQFHYLTDEQREHLKEFWNSIALRQNGNNQKSFLNIWDKLGPVYKRFNQALRKEGLAYEGMIYRDLAGQLQNNKNISFSFGKYIFAGFNALNQCEEIIFEYLQEKGKAEFFWDFDQYYLNDNFQEAGLFMRRNTIKYPSPNPLPYSTAQLEKKESFHIVSIPSSVGQAQIAGQILRDQGNEEFRFDNTAVVLCDEELLLPVLGALPSQIDTINVTMGFPLKFSPVYSFLKQLIELQKNSRKDKNGEEIFYHKNVLSILNHPMIIAIDGKESKEISKDIIRKNRIFIPGKELQKSSLLQQIFCYFEKISDLSAYFLNLLPKIFLGLENNESKTPHMQLQEEYVFQLYLAIKRLDDTLRNDGEALFGRPDFLTRTTYFSLIDQYVTALNVPFKGEPLNGLQIMGILETRALDFENLILLSTNEGIMPKTSSGTSFIPFNLRKGFGLPTIEEQNAMYSYYFYRLIQRAKNVTLAYDSRTEGLNTGEMSRYVHQLKIESKIAVEEKTVRFDIAPLQSGEIIIKKSPEIMKTLFEYSQPNRRAFSPSAVDTYLTCSLRFYFRYIAGMKEPEEVAEDIDAPMFGKIYHKVLEEIYKPFIGQEVKKEDLQKLLKHNKEIDRQLNLAFKTEYFMQEVSHPAEPDISGKNILIYEIIRKYVFQTLKIDLKTAPFKILALEKGNDLKYKINDRLTIYFKGITDRIDETNETIRIIDYKTGKAENRFKSIASLGDRENKSRNKAAFQTLIYSLFYAAKHPDTKKVIPGIYALRNIFQENFDALLINNETKQYANFFEVKDEFDKILKELFEDLFNPEIAFSPTDDLQKCSWCPYNTICHRN